MSANQIFPLIQTPARTFPSQRYRPGPIADIEIDLGVKTIYDRVDTIEQNTPSVPGELNGSKVSSGAIQVTGSLKAVATGLTTLSNIIVSIDAGAAPTNLTVTATPNANVAGTFDVYVWMPTSMANNTPILATVAAVVRWHAWGT